jgi:hypothetical protein
MEFYPRNESHAQRELEAQLNLFDPGPVAEDGPGLADEDAQPDEGAQPPAKQPGDLLYTVDTPRPQRKSETPCADFVAWMR